MANEHLDRAISAADKALEDHVSDTSKELDLVEYGRIHARALVAYIVNHLAEDKPMSTQAAFGYGMALDDLREIAGIESEKVYEHNDGN